MKDEDFEKKKREYAIKHPEKWKEHLRKRFSGPVPDPEILYNNPKDEFNIDDTAGEVPLTSRTVEVTEVSRAEEVDSLREDRLSEREIRDYKMELQGLKDQLETAHKKLKMLKDNKELYRESPELNYERELKRQKDHLNSIKSKTKSKLRELVRGAGSKLNISFLREPRDKFDI